MFGQDDGRDRSRSTGSEAIRPRIWPEPLGGELQRPVVDKTGLRRKVRFQFGVFANWLKGRDPQLPAGFNATPADDIPSGGSSLFKALQDQLGLNLESKKDPIDILVIDHIEKAPTEN